MGEARGEPRGELWGLTGGSGAWPRGEGSGRFRGLGSSASETWRGLGGSFSSSLSPPTRCECDRGDPVGRDTDAMGALLWRSISERGDTGVELASADRIPPMRSFGDLGIAPALPLDFASPSPLIFIKAWSISSCVYPDDGRSISSSASSDAAITDEEFSK
jgi:hypothetical protein